MFKRNLTLIFILSLVLWSCEELGIDPIKITVPAEASYSFDMPKVTINADDDNRATISETVDIANLIDENANQIESIKLDKMTYEVSGYDNTSGDVVLADIIIQTRANGNVTDILFLTGLVLENTGEIVAYEDGNPSSVLSAAQVASLELLMDNVEPFELLVTGDLTGAIDSDFTLSIAWDLSITVEQ